MHAFREHGHGSPRILYWFRTPPHVRVGRAALDEDAIRSIEEAHPDVVFDWTRILKSATPLAPAKAQGPRHPRRAKRGRAAGPTEPRGALETIVAPVEKVEAIGKIEGTAPAEESPLPAVYEAPEEPWVGQDEVEPAPPASHHVEDRVGRAGTDRLRARYAELLARITERVSDPVKLEELRTQAERLNPDTWVTDEEARRGIEGFDAAYEALRARLGRRRRRRRGRRKGGKAGSGKPEL